MTIRFDATKEDYALIEEIANRAIKAAISGGWVYEGSNARMDLTACHCNGNPLRLLDLLNADDFNFSHDVFGIQRNLDRKTGKLLNHFSPRYSKKGLNP
jgi:hypothetical protein